jgi:hypothetical protein
VPAISAGMRETIRSSRSTCGLPLTSLATISESLTPASWRLCQPVPSNLAIRRGDRMSNWQDMMRYCCTRTSKLFGQPCSITRGRRLSFSPSMIRTGVRSRRVGRSSPNGESGRNRMALASSPGRVRSRAAAVIAPLEKPIATAPWRARQDHGARGRCRLRRSTDQPR